MTPKMTISLALFAIAAGFGTGNATASPFRVNPRICSKKSIYRSGNRVVAFLAGTVITNISANVEAEPRVSEAIVPLCPSSTECVPRMSPTSGNAGLKVREIPICVPGTQCVPDITRPTGGDAGLRISEIPACPSGTQCGPDIAPPASVGSEFDEGE
jgi:hypothetical protein